LRAALHGSGDDDDVVLDDEAARPECAINDDADLQNWLVDEMEGTLENEGAETGAAAAAGAPPGLIGASASAPGEGATTWRRWAEIAGATRWQDVRIGKHYKRGRRVSVAYQMTGKGRELIRASCSCCQPVVKGYLCRHVLAVASHLQVTRLGCDVVAERWLVSKQGRAARAGPATAPGPVVLRSLVIPAGDGDPVLSAREWASRAMEVEQDLAVTLKGRSFCLLEVRAGARGQKGWAIEGCGLTCVCA